MNPSEAPRPTPEERALAAWAAGAHARTGAEEVRHIAKAIREAVDEYKAREAHFRREQDRAISERDSALARNEDLLGWIEKGNTAIATLKAERDAALAREQDLLTRYASVLARVEEVEEGRGFWHAKAEHTSKRLQVVETLAMCGHHLGDLRRIEALEAVLRAFADEVATAEHHATVRGGQQVPYHGDWSGALRVPSAMRALSRWAAIFREAIKGTK